MRSRLSSTLAVLVVGVALTVGVGGAIGSALGGGSDSSTSTYQAGKIMPRSNV